MKPVISIVPLRKAPTVSNARLQALQQDQRAREAEGRIPEGYSDDLSPFSEKDRLALRNLGVAVIVVAVLLMAVVKVWP